MSAQPVTTKELLDEGLTEEQIQQLISERLGVGATSCEVVIENNQKFLVCQWPPP